MYVSILPVEVQDVRREWNITKVCHRFYLVGKTLQQHTRYMRVYILRTQYVVLFIFGWFPWMKHVPSLLFLPSSSFFLPCQHGEIKKKYYSTWGNTFGFTHKSYNYFSFTLSVIKQEQTKTIHLVIRMVSSFKLWPLSTF